MKNCWLALPVVLALAAPAWAQVAVPEEIPTPAPIAAQLEQGAFQNPFALPAAGAAPAAIGVFYRDAQGIVTIVGVVAPASQTQIATLRKRLAIWTGSGIAPAMLGGLETPLDSRRLSTTIDQLARQMSALRQEVRQLRVYQTGFRGQPSSE